KDDKSVFYQGEKIIGADAKSFEALGDYYARDKNFGWHGKDTVKNSNGRTFKVINAYYSTDGKDYFYETEPLNVVDPRNFKFVYGEG
ncbi:DKNYY domain-containing protein, partial [Acinetobacter baumannii]